MVITCASSWHPPSEPVASSDFSRYYLRADQVEYILFSSGKKAQSGDESETYDEFVEAGEELLRLAQGKSIRRRKKKKRKDDDEERAPINEEPIVAEELIPLMDQTIARTDGKALLNARVIFVIGESIVSVRRSPPRLR